MAKPMHQPDISFDLRAGKAAGRVLDARIADVREHAAAAMVGDVEGIHDMRVSVKRLRETMRLFRRLLPTKRRLRAMPMVELLNEALGEVRELDVLCLDAEGLSGQIEDDGGLVERAVRNWTFEREDAFGRLLRVWGRLSSDGLFDLLDEVARRARRRKLAANQRDLQHFAYEAVTRALERVDTRLHPALEAEDPELLHSLRIAIKRLKYGMEPFRAIAPRLKTPWKIVSFAQEALGEAHDLDVLRSRLTEYLAHVEDHRLDSAEDLLRLLDSRRGESYQRAREAIVVLAAPDFTRSLLDAID